MRDRCAFGVNYRFGRSGMEARVQPLDLIGVEDAVGFHEGDGFGIFGFRLVAVGAFGLLAEYIQSTQDLSLGGRSDTLTHRAWQVVGRYLLTGEQAGFGSLVPSQPYAIGKPGWGAWEIVARVGRLALDDDADALGYVAANEEKTFDTYGLGVNGYLSRNVRIAANYDVTRFRNFSGADRADERALFTRLQLAF